MSASLKHAESVPMAENHEEHSSLIKTPKQLIIVVVLAFVVPIGLIVMLTQLITSSPDMSKGNPALSQEAVAKRLKPVGEVVVDASQPQPAPAAQVAVAAAPVPGAAKVDAGKGKSVYDSACTVCHAAGVAGAPKAGDKVTERDYKGNVLGVKDISSEVLFDNAKLKFFQDPPARR